LSIFDFQEKNKGATLNYLNRTRIRRIRRICTGFLSGNIHNIGVIGVVNNKNQSGELSIFDFQEKNK